ncbi:MAG: rhomboid family intramembrane serine protease [Planctomycetota bacterium]
MTIRFQCPKCGKALSVKNECAGKKGKCTCGAVVVVPNQADGDVIRFACGTCGRRIKVPRTHAGRQGRCPQCKNIVVIPAADSQEVAGPESVTVEGNRQVQAGMLRFRCSACNGIIEARASSAGNLMECPKCGGFTGVPDGEEIGQEAGGGGIGTGRQAKPSTGKVICPSCGRKLSDDATVCIGCGIYVHSGRPILMARGMDEDMLYERARKVVSPVSWLIPFGIYPVYSEVMGHHRPYSIWTIAALTVLISAWFLGYQYTNSPKMRSMKNLMLWAGRDEPDAKRIQLLYKFTNYGDSKAFLAKREELKDTTPEDELDIAAMKELSPEEQCFGQYRPAQLITHAFLHGGPLHLAGNMLFLLIFGSRVGSVVGNIWTPILYVLLAIAAGFTHMMMSQAQAPTAMLGASGAIMGMAGVYLVLFPIHRIFMTAWWRWGLIGGFHLSFNVFALRGFWVVLFYILFDIVAVSLAFRTGTAHWAHIGGLLWGMVAGLVLLVGRAAYSRTDVLSLILGKYAWPLIGTPHRRG